MSSKATANSTSNVGFSTDAKPARCYLTSLREPFGLQVPLELDEPTCKTLKGIAIVGRFRVVTQDRNGKVASAARALEWAYELCERGLLRIRLVIDPGSDPLAFGAVEFAATPAGDEIAAAWSCEASLAEQSPADEAGSIAAE